MNGKRAKRLRRVAEAATVGMPAVRYTREARCGWALTLAPGCTRHAYKMLKRGRQL